MNVKEKYTVTEVSEKLKVSKRTILREIARGKLKIEKVGRRYLISEDILSSYLTNSSEKSRENLQSFLSSCRQEMISTLQKMVSMPSISSKIGGELKLALFIKKILDKWDIRNVLYVKGHAVSIKATIGFKNKGILFDAPIDTLPIGSQNLWTYPPFDGAIDGGKMFGRGTADCKAGIVAILFTLLFLKRNVPEEKIKVEAVFDGGEQDGSFLGMKEVLSHGLSAESGIIGYAGSGEDILLGARGYHRYEFTTYGKAVHTGSRYKTGINAINKMVDFISLMEKLTLPHGSTPFFDFGCRKTFSEISGGTAINMVPDSCTSKLDVRVVPGVDKRYIDKAITQVINSAKSKDPEFDIKYTYMVGHEAYCVSQNEKIVKNLVEAVKGSLKKSPILSGSGPSHIGNLLAEKGIPTLVFGPIGENVHSYNEYVEVSSIPQTTQIYVNTVLNYFEE